MKRSTSKRKSLDSGEIISNGGIKKQKQRTQEVPWYIADEQQAKQKQQLLKKMEKEQRSKEKEKKRFFGLGGLLTRMRSSSKLITGSTSRLPRMDAMHPEVPVEDPKIEEEDSREVRDTTPETGPPVFVMSSEVLRSARRNARLKSFLGDDIPTEVIAEAPEYHLDEKENEVFFVCGRSVIRKSNVSELDSEEALDKCPSPEPFSRSSRHSRRTPRSVKSVKDAENDEDPLATPKRAPLAQLDDLETTPVKSEDRSKTPRSGLRASGFSSGALGRFGGLLKRGLSSVGGSRPGSQASTPVHRVTRRDSSVTENSKSETWKKRRCSDVTCYNDLQAVLGTPTSSLRPRRINQQEMEALQRFEDIVSVSLRTAQAEIEARDSEDCDEFDVVVADSLANGRPISEFSSWLFKYFDVETQVQENIRAACVDRFTKTCKIAVPASNTNKELIISIGIVRDSGSNLAVTTRIGYDAAIMAACEDKKVLSVLVAPAFLPCDTPYNSELAEAMLKTLFRTVSSLPALKKVVICGRNSSERDILEHQLETLLAQKHHTLNTSSAALPTLQREFLL